MEPLFDLDSTTQVLRLDLGQMPQALIVDDDELVLEHLAMLLKAAGFQVQVASNGALALEALQSSFAPILITDRQMPVMDGLALCRAVRQAQWPGYVYIVLLTAHDSEEEILQGLDAGADDYLGKRASSAQLLARMRTARRILSLERSLKQALDEKRRLALIDPLTGVANRRYFLQRLEREFSRAERSGERLCLLLLDIDHFKKTNDRFGHAAGDAVLREFVQRVSQHLRRQTDWCARIGGEEFVVVLRDIDSANARSIAESICTAVASQPVNTPPGPIDTTVSIGVSYWNSSMRGSAMDAEVLLRRADQALYASKEGGRNRVTLAVP